jgi:hypothetical protein
VEQKAYQKYFRETCTRKMEKKPKWLRSFGHPDFLQEKKYGIHFALLMFQTTDETLTAQTVTP